MTSLNNVFLLYTPVYIYVLLVLYVMVFFGGALSKGQSATIQGFHQTHRPRIYGTLFLLAMASLLGTPPTAGFFGKALMFYVLVKNPGLELAVCVIMTLVLLIFYLQTIRTRGALRKKNKFSRQDYTMVRHYALLVPAVMMLVFPLLLTTLADIFWALSL